MKTPCLILLALVTLLASHSAQAAAGRTCRIVFLDRPENAPKSLHLFDGVTSQEVELPSMNLSPSYKLAPDVTQLKLLISKVGDPKEVPADAPSVDIPSGYTDFLLLVLSDPDNKISPVKMEAVNLVSDHFKVGQTLWSNRTDKTIQGKLGDQALSLEPESSKIVDAPVSENGVATSGYYSASFTYQIQDQGAFEPITEQQWWHDAKSRHLGFIVNAGGKLPKIYFYRDFRDPAPSE